MAERERRLRALSVAITIVAAAYAANAFFNHTAPGLAAKTLGDVYVFAFFLPLGVVVPAVYLGWAAGLGLASPRRLGAAVGGRDAVAVGVAVVVGGLLATGALATQLHDPGFAQSSQRLFALLLVASTAETLLFLGVLANTVQLAMPGGRWRAGLLAFIVSCLAFGFFHFTYPAPWNTLAVSLRLTLVWVPISLLFLLSRSLLGAVVLNNIMAVIGFVTNRLELPGSTTKGWVQAVCAAALFVVLFRLTVRRAGRP